MRTFKQLTNTDRVRIETLFIRGYSVREIADTLRVHISTIYRELKRGRYIKLTTLLKEQVSYSSDLGQQRHNAKMAAKGVAKKIGSDPELANYIETKILDQHYSPAAVLGEIKQKQLDFKVHICVATLYNYISQGVFSRISNKNLPEKGRRKRRYHKIHPTAHKRVYGDGIEKRDQSVLTREEFGHWEMDTVKGTKSSKCSLLVFTERKTRKEIIIKLEHHAAKEVVNQLDKIERKLKQNFPKIFKTITCDNGVEFQKAEAMAQSCLYEGKKRTNIYYCHPYTSCERGSNEVANKMIRRHIPKGKSFDDISDSEVKEIENWINTYPRKIFNYATAEDMFLREISAIP